MNNKDLQVAINNVRTSTVIRYPSKHIIRLLEFFKRLDLVTYEQVNNTIVLKKASKLKKVTLNKLTNQFVAKAELSLQKKRLVDEGYGELVLSTPKGIMTTAEALSENHGGILLGYVNYRYKG